MRRFGAVLWTALSIAACDEALTVPPHEDAQRIALEAVYRSLNGPEWTDNGGWLTDAPVGTWQGVTADAAGVVTHIDLTGNNVTGSIPEEVGRLTGLVQLILWNNDVGGTIPPALANLERLELLDLDWNRIEGPVPPALGALARLEKLYLAKNLLTGAPPPSLSNLAALRVLHMDCNAFAGAIPEEWTALRLEAFHWSNTGLTVGSQAVEDWIANIPDTASPTGCDREPVGALR